MLKMKTNGFALIPNVAFAFGTEYKLNADEYKMFAYLQFSKSVGAFLVRTNLVIIIEDLGWSTSNKWRDKERCASTLTNLMTKGYLECAFEKDIKKDILTIKINDEMKNTEVKSKVEWKQKPFTFKKFTAISPSDYNLADGNDYHMIMIGYHLWRKNLEEKYDFIYAICDKEWADVLELSVKQARTIIDECTPFLTKISGAKFKDENGQWRQETNTYVLDKHMSVGTKLEKVQTEIKNASYDEKHMDKILDATVLTDRKIYNQIFNFKKFLEDDGFKVWKETTCEHTKKTGQIKIDNMKKTEGGRMRVERFEKEYLPGIDSKKFDGKEERKRQQEIMMKRSELILMDDFEDEEEKQAREKRQAEIRERKRAKDRKMQRIFEDN